jgi:hypothetical protein
MSYLDVILVANELKDNVQQVWQRCNRSNHAPSECVCAILGVAGGKISNGLGARYSLNYFLDLRLRNCNSVPLWVARKLFQCDARLIAMERDSGRTKGPVCGVENCRSRWYEEGEDGYLYCQNGHRKGVSQLRM